MSGNMMLRRHLIEQTKAAEEKPVEVKKKTAKKSTASVKKQEQ